MESFAEHHPNSIAVTRKEYLIERCSQRALYVYGTGEEAIAFSQYLSRLKIETVKFIDERRVGEAIDNKEVISLIDLVYEKIDKIFIVIVMPEEYYGSSRQSLLDMGLVEDIDFTYHSDVPLTKEAKCYDVTLSYNRKMYDIEGFELFGDINNPDAKKIVALGGSTTESTYLFIKGWAQYLAEILNNNNMPTVIYCGGVAGYSSSQELLKLIRDVLPLRPDLIISYSGLNDLYGYPKPTEQIRNGRPFITHFQVEFIEKIMKKLLESQANLPVMHDLMWDDNGMDTVYFGLKNNKSASELWLDNARIMHSIAQEFNIEFISFFQPFAFNGFYEIDEVQKILYNRKSPTCIIDGYKKWGEPYAEDVKKIIESINKYDYIYDFSRLFENHPAVYFDASHVYEHGNQIIAKAIYEILIPLLRRTR